MQFLKELNINFLGMKWVGIAISTVAILTCLFFLFTTGITMGIDFSGGHLIHYKFQEMPAVEEVREKLRAINLGNAVIQTDPGNHEVMIRVQVDDEEQFEEAADNQVDAEEGADQLVISVTETLRSSEELQKIEEQNLLDLNTEGTERITALLMEGDPLDIMQRRNLNRQPEDIAQEIYNSVARQLITDYRDSVNDPEDDKYAGIIHDMDNALAQISLSGDEDVELVRNYLRENTFLGNFAMLRAERVSPVVGSELAELAVWAVIYSLAGILVYIWFRFNNRFSVAAIAALVHDVIITLGAFAISGREFNLPIVAAVLTIVGYSLNDTIVIFTRIREMLTLRRKEAKEDYDGVLNRSINLTISRTLLTSVTTMIVVLFLYFMGGTVINDFAFTLVVGIIVGTYSSVFVASPVLSIWNMVTGTTGKKMTTGVAKAKA